MDKNQPSILIIDDDDDILFTAKMALKTNFKKITTIGNPAELPMLLKNESFDVILLDMNFRKDENSGEEGYFWLKKILEIDPMAVVIFMTAFGDVNKAVKSIKMGATDFILKPWQNEKLIATTSAATKLRNSLKEVDHLRTQRQIISDDIDKDFYDIIGSSSAIMNVFDIISKVSETDANILILGENGTGKELIARAVHRRSIRKDKVFINVDMGAISETLFESELFGHIKGAFTDAKESRMGRFEAATGGTLFLDEIGNLPVHLQSKLLATLENRQITPLGSNLIIPLDIRLISATNQPLFKMVKDKEFREDLLYRINTVEINLPPLRERIEDISLLANHFLTKYSQKYRKTINGFTSASYKKLEAYRWPGNIRELQHVVERTTIMSNNPDIQPHDIYLSGNETHSNNELFDNYNLENIEEIIVKKILVKHQGNISKAANELGLTRTSLYRRMEKYEI